MEGFCKACLVRYEDPSELLQYTEKNRRLFVYCTGLQVKPNEVIPFQICQACFLKLKVACQFKKQCRTSDKRLNHFLTLKEAGEETDLSTYLQNNAGSTLFKFPLNGASTPSYQYSKQDDNVSTSTSMRNFMADFLREDEVPDTEAHIIREMIEQEADVLDESLDSQWLQEDISIASDFRFSPYSTPVVKHSYQPLLNYSPVKEESQVAPVKEERRQVEKQNLVRKNLLSVKKLLLNSISCKNSQTDSPKSQQEDTDEETDLSAKNISSESSSYVSENESVEEDESNDHNNFIARKRMLLNLKSNSNKSETELKAQQGKDMEIFLATKSILMNSKPNSIKSENEESEEVAQNANTKEKHKSNRKNNANQDILIASKGFYVENYTNENAVKIEDIDDADDIGEKDNIDKNLEKLLNNTNDEVISLSALLASPSSEAAPAGNNIIATPSVHQGLSGANTPTIANILFGEKLDDEQSVQRPYLDYKEIKANDKSEEYILGGNKMYPNSQKPGLDCKVEPDDKSNVDILEDFFNKETGEYVGKTEKDEDEIFEEYKNPKLDGFIPGKSQFDLTDFSCKKCNIRYKSERGLKIHFVKAHNFQIVTQRKKEPRVDLPCDQCGKVFSLRSNLSRHIKVMHLAPKKPQRCKVCSIEFTSEGKLELHMKTHTGVKYTPRRDNRKPKNKNIELVCPICGHLASQSYNLKVHIARHKKAYRVRCDVCDHGFYRKTDLEIHMRLHMNMKPFQCKQCSQSFTRKCSLQIHVKRHAGERPYVCEICKSRFATSARLLNHKKKSIKCQHMKAQAAFKENKAIEESIDQLFVSETQVNLGNDKILLQMKDKTINDKDQGDETNESLKPEDIVMEDLTSNPAKEDLLEDAEDDKMSISDLLSMPIIIAEE